MMRRRMFLALALTGVPRAAAAQAPADLLARGIQAYQALAYDSAADFLDRGLHPGRGGDSLTPEQRLRALTYLGATEVFRGHQAEAVAAFRWLIQTDPAYRPDELVFPPQVTDLFGETRRTTPALVITAPPTAHIVPGRDRLPFVIRASALDRIVVSLLRAGGDTVRRIYAGPASDSMVAAWDGLAADAAPVPGTYTLSAEGNGRFGPRTSTLQVEVARDAVDTLPWPDSAIVTPAAAPPRESHAGRSLAAGLVTGGAVILLPSLVTNGGGPMPERFGVAAAASLSGILAFLAGRRSARAPAARSDPAARAAWQSRVSAVREENELRRSGAPLEVRITHPATPEATP